MQKQRMNWSYEELWNIAAAYGKTWTEQPKVISMIGWIGQESKLAYPKEIIKHALATLLLIEEDNESISLSGRGYTSLDSFVSDEVYKFVSSKLAIKNYTTMNEEYKPTKEDADRMRMLITNLSQEEHELWSKILSEKNTEFKRLSNGLKILLEIIGDPNDFAKYLE